MNYEQIILRTLAERIGALEKREKVRDREMTENKILDAKNKELNMKNVELQDENFKLKEEAKENLRLVKSLEKELDPLKDERNYFVGLYLNGARRPKK